MSRSALVLALLLASCVAPIARAAPSVENVVQRQDGIVTDLKVTEGAARVDLRFEKPIGGQQVTLWVDGVRIEPEAARPYPAPGQATAIMGLLDLGGGTVRALSVVRLKAAAIRLLQSMQPHDKLLLAAYAAKAQLISASGGNPAELAKRIVAAPMVAGTSALSDSLAHAVATVQGLPASRRAVFVLTDGHDDGSLPLASAFRAARDAGVVVYALVSRDERPADLADLARLVGSTGGIVVTDPDLPTFLDAPFASLDSGWTVDYDLSAVRRWPWRDAVPLTVEITADGVATPLRLDLAYRAAIHGPGDLVAFLTTTVAGWITDAVVLAMAAVLATVFFARRRRANVVSPEKTAPPPVEARVSEQRGGPARDTATATLQPSGGGTPFHLDGLVTRVGRAQDNHLVLDDQTVSRAHAILERDRTGRFSLTNLSASNPTIVNGDTISKTTLDDGDTIQIGQTTFVLHVGMGKRNEVVTHAR